MTPLERRLLVTLAHSVATLMLESGKDKNAQAILDAADQTATEADHRLADADTEQYRLAMEKVTPNLLKDNTFCRRVIADGRVPDPVTGLPLETDAEFQARMRGHPDPTVGTHDG